MVEACRCCALKKCNIFRRKYLFPSGVKFLPFYLSFPVVDKHGRLFVHEGGVVHDILCRSLCECCSVLLMHEVAEQFFADAESYYFLMRSLRGSHALALQAESGKPNAGAC